MICRGVVTAFNERNLWGKLVYAVDERGHNAIDAISAALLANELHAAAVIRNESIKKTTKVMEFHSTSFHNGIRQEWPLLGQLVEVHLNNDQNLVAVWYPPSERR